MFACVVLHIWRSSQVNFWSVTAPFPFIVVPPARSAKKARRRWDTAGGMLRSRLGCRRDTRRRAISRRPRSYESCAVRSNRSIRPRSSASRRVIFGLMARGSRSQRRTAPVWVDDLATKVGQRGAAGQHPREAFVGAVLKGLGKDGDLLLD